MPENGMKKHALSLYMSNKPGVLVRIALVFARRGFNIDSLVVSEGHNPEFSHMNIVATGGEEALEQILKQLNKLIDVVYAKDSTVDDSIQRELALIKVSCPPDKRTEVLQVSNAFRGETVDLSADTITFQVSGDSRKIDTVQEIFSHYGIIEMVRSGKILIERGGKA
jgi:acetolactate synthase-1/3 small subunit